jgi:hypothetical protein
MSGTAAASGEDAGEVAAARRAARILAAVAVHRRDGAGDARKHYRVAEKKGEELSLELRPAEDGCYEVRCGGDTLAVDIAASDRAATSIIVDGVQFEAVVDAKKANSFEVIVAGHLFRLEAEQRGRLKSGDGVD